MIALDQHKIYMYILRHAEFNHTIFKISSNRDNFNHKINISRYIKHYYQKQHRINMPIFVSLCMKMYRIQSRYLLFRIPNTVRGEARGVVITVLKDKSW